MLKNNCYLFFLLLLCCFNSTKAQQKFFVLNKKLNLYHASLDSLRKLYNHKRSLPPVDFYLFGMGNRTKMIYKNGLLLNAITGDTLYRWPVKNQLIVPSEYYVYIATKDKKTVHIFEDSAGVYLVINGNKKTLSQSHLFLPEFKEYYFAPVLKVLHHEVLINIINGKPVPNLLVYKKPWYRDATLMAMVLQKTNNVSLIKQWILGIKDPFDRNNHGIAEADNPGEALFLLSLVTDKNYPLVNIILDSVKQFIKGNYIEGLTDYAAHPVFQTKWLKFGLQALHLKDTFNIPKVYDSYSSLFWWAYKNEHVKGNIFDEDAGKDYPYLVWAEDHFYETHNGWLPDRDYPLTWEANASDAYYPAMKKLDSVFVKKKLCSPHTWHAAEMFLLLSETNKN